MYSIASLPTLSFIAQLSPTKDHCHLLCWYLCPDKAVQICYYF